METGVSSDGKQADLVCNKAASPVLVAVRGLESGQQQRRFCKCGLSLPCNGCLAGRSSFVNAADYRPAKDNSPGLTVRDMSELKRALGLITYGTNGGTVKGNGHKNRNHVSGDVGSSTGGQTVPVTDAAPGRCETDPEG